MRVSPQLLGMALIFGTTAGAQTAPSTPAPQPKTPPAQTQSVPSSGITLTTGTQLVVVDVVVQDRDGHPIHGLKATDFMMDENKKPQPIKSFDEHSAANAANAKFPPPIPMPPGTFTNYTPVPPDSTLNVLLLDALNTPMKDQSYVRYQLQQYVKHANPGSRIAIFGLTTHLILLQGFSADPDILKGAVEHRLIPRASVLLDDPTGANTDPVSMTDIMSQAGASASAVAGVQQFEAQNATFQTELRTRYTLDAFNQMARYLAAFPGRKNLIWFSGSFPISIFADPDLNDPFAAMADFTSQIRETTNLLDRSRVAVYPIDARGLQTTPMFDASRSGAAYVRNPGRMTSDIGKFNQAQAAEHMTMDQIADDTGGHAFYNTNGLADAVAKSIESGANYYTIAYSPTNHDWNGSYRSIRVQLQGTPAGQGYKLSYRHGYYADDPNARHSTSSLLAATPAGTPPANTVPYGELAMQRGAPTPAEILFKVRVLPTSTATEDTVAPQNSLNPNNPMKGPFRRYQVDYAALGADFKLPLEADGHHHGAAEFITYVYDADGKLLNIEGHTVNMNLPPDVYTQLMKSGLSFTLQISAPAKSESFLRIGVHDLVSGRFGVVEVPTTTVARLPPPPIPAAAPAPAAAAPAAASRPAPSLSTAPPK